MRIGTIFRSCCVNHRAKYKTAQIGQGIDDFLVLTSAVIEPDDRAAAAGKVGAGPDGSSRLNHAEIVGSDLHDRFAKIEILVDDFVKFFPVSGQER